MAEARTRFTAIGTRNSGKTCYVVGMYYQLITGYKGFSLKSGGDTVSRLENWMDTLDDEVGQSRFPAMTATEEITDYEFKLKYALKDVMTFNWIDYGGGTLSDREKNPQAYYSLMDSISQSATLYIFINGEWLYQTEKGKKLETKEERIKYVKRNARVLNDYLMEFAENHQFNMPPFVFVITKSDIWLPYLEEDEIYDIMKECFSSVMVEGCRAYVVGVSLGNDISDDDYSGEVDPVDMHIPFFIGIYHQFLNFCMYLKSEINDETQRNLQLIHDNNNYIDNRQREIGRENSKKNGFFRRLFYDESNVDMCEAQIRESRREINEANNAINSNNDLFMHYKKLMQAVSSQLLRDSSKFCMFEDGYDKEFNAEEMIDL